MPRDLVIIGTGKLASNILEQLVNCDNFRLYLVGRNSDKINHLINQYPSIQELEISNIPDNAVCIICVSDSAIAEIAQLIPQGVSLVIHCSGSLPLKEISLLHQNTAVVWPVQSFTYQLIEWSEIPLIVEKSNNSFDDLLNRYLNALGGPVSIMDYEQRKRLHLAAVILNNFSNHIFALAQEYCLKNSLPFETLIPLIEQTVVRIGNSNIADLQTGPAIREDSRTISAHLELLKNDKLLSIIYSTISNSIIEFAKNKKADK